MKEEKKNNISIEMYGLLMQLGWMKQNEFDFLLCLASGNKKGASKIAEDIAAKWGGISFLLDDEKRKPLFKNVPPPQKSAPIGDCKLRVKPEPKEGEQYA